ncbi:MAG: NHLP family bacteriocin export ABC transporter peptidase/permease/ATPase subunit [Chlorobiaceae bacterium]|nr:NHLP family bacteriocin export ABC transporter peptidase/permease/ATPase subunit [Chlorobiaceae bacterium]
MSFMLFPTAKLWNEARVKTPTVLQMEATECGAASLAMVLAWFGLSVPLEKLRADCGVSRDGSKASALIKAAEKYGLEAKGCKLDLDDLHRMKLPMIIFWNMYHFVVFEGFRKGQYYINDPGSGQRKVTLKEFSDSYSGIAITFEKTASFSPGGQPFRLSQALKKRLPGLEKALAFIILTSLLLVVPGLLVPSFLRIYIDYVLVKGTTGWIQPLMIGMLLTALLQGTLTWLQQSCILRTETKLSLVSSAKFFNHVFALPMRFFTMRQAGEISNRIQLNDQVATMLAGELSTKSLNVLLIVFYALLMLRYDIILTLGAVIIAIINTTALIYVSRKRISLNRKFLHDNGKLLGTTFYGIRTIESLKASGSEQDFFSRWAGLFANMVSGRQQLQTATLFLLALPPFLQSLGNVAILSLGGFRVMEGDLTIGMLFAFQSLLLSFLAPVNQMVSLAGKLQDAEAGIQRLDDVIDNECELPAPDDKLDATELMKLNGAIELKNVTFGYNPLDPPLIENFSLRLRPGDRIALVGGSGSGKSTIARLVAGLYEPWSGEVLFDGNPRKDIPRKQLSLSIGMVDQEISLFEGTIAENISMWDMTMPHEEIIRASMDAAVHEVIIARTGGYQSMLDEGGRNFSGGQRQRIEIARALSQEPSILILDEATSALDPATEKIIDSNIRNRGCSCLIVAHRLSTIRDCDEIIVLDAGKVVERGTHTLLMEAGGAYAGLVAKG